MTVPGHDSAGDDETRPVRTADLQDGGGAPTDDSNCSVADYNAIDERPDPDHPGKVEKPTDLRRPSVMLAVRRSVREFLDDGCTDLAAALTYYPVLAIFPAALALLSLLGVVGQGPSSAQGCSTCSGHSSIPRRCRTSVVPCSTWRTARPRGSRW